MSGKGKLDAAIHDNFLAPRKLLFWFPPFRSISICLNLFRISDFRLSRAVSTV